MGPYFKLVESHDSFILVTRRIHVVILVLQSDTVCYSVLQFRVVFRSVLQCVAPSWVYCSVLQCTTVWLRRTVMYYSVMHCGAAWYREKRVAVFCSYGGAVWCDVVQCVGVYCRVLRVYSAVCYSVVQQDIHRVRNALVTALSHKHTILPHSHQSSKATSCVMRTRNRSPPFAYGVATISTLLKIIGLFCKRAL